MQTQKHNCCVLSQLKMWTVVIQIKQTTTHMSKGTEKQFSLTSGCYCHKQMTLTTEMQWF